VTKPDDTTGFLNGSANSRGGMKATLMPAQDLQEAVVHKLRKLECALESLKPGKTPRRHLTLAELDKYGTERNGNVMSPSPPQVLLMLTTDLGRAHTLSDRGIGKGLNPPTQPSTGRNTWFPN
jgi:hypothetical protein